MSKEEVREVLELLAQNEEALASLYSEYAIIHPNTEFWKKIAQDERIHAQWVRVFIADMEQEKATFNLDDFKTQAIRNSIESIKESKNEAKKETLKEALGYAINLERSMLENDFFKVIETKDENLNHVLEALKKGTEVHLQKMKVEANNLDLAIEVAEE